MTDPKQVTAIIDGQCITATVQEFVQMGKDRGVNIYPDTMRTRINRGLRDDALFAEPRRRIGPGARVKTVCDVIGADCVVMRKTPQELSMMTGGKVSASTINLRYKNGHRYLDKLLSIDRLDSTDGISYSVLLDGGMSRPDLYKRFCF